MARVKGGVDVLTCCCKHCCTPGNTRCYRKGLLDASVFGGTNIKVPVIEASSVSPRVPPPGQVMSGMIFCAKSPTLGDKLLSNFPRGRGGVMGRGSFHAKVLVLFIKNGRLPLELIKKHTVDMQEDFLRKFCSCVCYLQT